MGLSRLGGQQINHQIFLNLVLIFLDINYYLVIKRMSSKYFLESALKFQIFFFIFTMNLYRNLHLRKIIQPKIATNTQPS